jgi:hypothetical protein
MFYEYYIYKYIFIILKKRSSFALNCCCFFSSLFVIDILFSNYVIKLIVIDILFSNYVIKLIEFVNLIQLNNHNLRCL